MVDLVGRFTSLSPAASAAKAQKAVKPAAPQAAKAGGVEVALSSEARTLLDQIAAARGERAQEGTRPKPPGSRLNIVV